MGFRPHISPNLRGMDPRIFRPGPMGIGPSFVELPARKRKIA
jgi:propionate CoA-transferase